MNIRQARVRAGLLQEQLATAAVTPNSYLSKLERGAAPCSPAMAERLAAALGEHVTAEELLAAQAELYEGQRQQALSIARRPGA